MVKVDSKKVTKMLKELEGMGPDVMKESGKFFKAKTPIASGNARRSTSTKNTTIKADYGYAARLDEGWSSQAPRGMSDDTIKDIDQQVGKLVKKLNR
tara:strand:+ start:5234 stop:5524 length:291 start_codon:yes stop_codon:yes gene_type:complete